MFRFIGLMQSMGISFLVLLLINFLMGMFHIGGFASIIIISFICTYILNGMLSAHYNPNAPYFSSYIGGITLTILNFWCAQLFFDWFVWDQTNLLYASIFINSAASLLATYITLKSSILIKRRVAHDS